MHWTRSAGLGECVAAEINGVGAAGFADGVIAGVNENARTSVAPVSPV